jgi:site-specific recombinase XerD
MDHAVNTQSMYGAIADASHQRLPPIDLSHHYSKTTKNRNASSVKDFYKYFRIPNIGNLAGGELPHE